MNKKYKEIFKDHKFIKHIVDCIHIKSKKKIKIMEVCGTHTVAIFRSGIRSLLPDNIDLCSGPGCPVCVTTQEEIDMFIELAKHKNVIITTFGDLIRVPGTYSTLQKESINGADIRIVYSTFDALDIARQNPKKKVVFLGIGFETTAPTVAAAIISAKHENLNNFCVVSAHKSVPPALEILAQCDQSEIDGFILPGHVSVIIGLKAYKFLEDVYNIPSIVTGFEPLDLLRSILLLVNYIESGMFKVENAYLRAVSYDGNLKAMSLLSKVFNKRNANWRGLGSVSNSGFFIKDEYSLHDAGKIFEIKLKEHSKIDKCECGNILMGIKNPTQCKLYMNLCTPSNPVGPCMVSTEGTCAAYRRYS